MIVMKPTATEQEVQAVIDRVQSVGARAHLSRGDELTVIGAIGDREHVARLELEGAPGVDRVVPISKPYKLSSTQFKHGERTVLDIAGRKVGGEHFAMIAGPCTVESREQTLETARAVRDAGGDAVPRRRLQAAHLAVRVPGARPGGAAAARRGQGRDRAADRHRADGPARPRAGARGGRRDPDRRAQHAELHAAGRGRALRLPGAAQARLLLDARGAADGRRVRPQGGQRVRDAVRARDPHVRDRLPLHARPDGRPGAQGAQPPAGDRRPEPRRRPARPGDAAVAGRRRGRAPTGSSSRSTRIRNRRSATGRSSCTPTSSPSTWSASRPPRRSRARRSPPSKLEGRGRRRRADRRLDRARRARAARRVGRGLRPRAASALALARERGAIDRAADSVADAVADAEAVFVAVPVGVLPDAVGAVLARARRRTAWSPTSARPSARSSPRTTTRGSSAAIRSPAPRPPGSSTRARTCSTARPGT